MERSNQQYTIYTILQYCNTLLFVRTGSTANISSRRVDLISYSTDRYNNRNHPLAFPNSPPSLATEQC